MAAGVLIGKWGKLLKAVLAQDLFFHLKNPVEILDALAGGQEDRDYEPDQNCGKDREDGDGGKQKDRFPTKSRLGTAHTSILHQVRLPVIGPVLGPEVQVFQPVQFVGWLRFE